MNSPETRPLWTPDAERVARARITDYQRWLETRKGKAFPDYPALWQWSVDHLEDFYQSVWEYFDLRSSAPCSRVLGRRAMPGAQWFEGARLNLAEQVFRFHLDDSDRPAILSRSEIRPQQALGWGALRTQVAAAAQGLRALGVGPGDRVVAYLPNLPETLVAFLAVASLGAIWSSCSPDMGTRSVLDRFRQIDPKVMLAVDGYRYGGKDFDRLPVVAGLRDALPTLGKVVLLPYLDPQARLDGALPWDDLLAQPAAPMRFEQVPFDHPLWVVYSSGTTGLPKPIVHGHGGVLLKGLQDLALQMDIGPRDRFMWFTTTGWIMWNIQMMGLLTGATVCLYDGNPGYPDMNALWDFSDQAEVTFFGAGAAYFLACRKAGIEPGKRLRPGRLRTVGSTGSPLSDDGYRWLMRQFPDVLVAALSGGTDVAAAYVGPCPVLPVYAGEMQCRYLGTAVRAYDDEGRSLDDAVGELVVTEPMPCMPLYFWNDPDGSRYRDSYFSVFPGVWRHGDWIRITPRGGAIIYGRSDTTINRHGIRMGTAEIYRVLEAFPEVLDCMVVDLEYLGRESYMPLFVVLRDGQALSDALAARMKAAIRDNLSARHVPDDILAAPAIPRTLSGKKMELPVKRLLLGEPLDKVINPDAMSNPDCLPWYLALGERRRR
ncbi:acetoacetate--CoA ligase [uncultured Castellaniella sp.]|uniref:acetoacetate--CoA ligase n=1 Tax=uncultured Castellaniella sp. TaxID=647907 RepID=UPI002638E7A6|nr:acetoacetate--CoA ligase [uncultured Castellaniella sp.]